MKILYEIMFCISVLVFGVFVYKYIAKKQSEMPMWIALVFIWIFNIMIKIS